MVDDENGFFAGISSPNLDNDGNSGEIIAKEEPAKESSAFDGGVPTRPSPPPSPPSTEERETGRVARIGREKRKRS